MNTIHCSGCDKPEQVPRNVFLVVCAACTQRLMRMGIEKSEGSNYHWPMAYKRSYAIPETWGSHLRREEA